jgi:GT2 family glycosyltransferase
MIMNASQLVPQTVPEFSFCIVNLNAVAYLRGCLDSLPQAVEELTYEVIVVDNGSTDGSLELLAREYPMVRVIENHANTGYTYPMNQALKAARGRFLVQLNPDTISHPGAYAFMRAWMAVHPETGICSPKVLNRDGTFQRQCRRSAARPWDVITYFSGLWKVFPRSRFWGRYLVTYRGEDETCEVEAVSGSCMFIRREVIEQIGYLDERYFAYQEDSDFCFRVRQADWKVVFTPEARVTHFGGQGGSTFQPYHAIYQWHRSYYLYYRKFIARDYFFLVNGLMYLAMALKLAGSLLANLLRRQKVVGTRKP